MSIRVKPINNHCLKKVFVVLIFIAFSSSLFAEPYIVIAKKQNFNKSLINKIKTVGGDFTKVHKKYGIAFVKSKKKSFVKDVSKLFEIRSVIKDKKFQWLDPKRKMLEAKTKDISNPPNTNDDDFYFDAQWGHDAINAPEAWALGAAGAGVRVAVLDDGIDSDHPDIAPNINISLCKSFVPGQTFEYNENFPGDPFSHGTHTSGTILAANNGYGTIGVAPEAELVMVKVLDSYTGSGNWSWILNGIIYATDIGADVINMSIGGWAEKTIENAEFLYALGVTTQYAWKKGTTVIASAGNEGVNGEEFPNYVHLPSQAPKVLAISATAPEGWALDNYTNLDVPASYSNYGINHIDFAAPGGDYDFGNIDGTSVCTISGLTQYCYVFDFVFSTGSAGGWYWSVGTSMASPHVAGVAALMIGEAGGSLSPDAVFTTLRKTSDDLGPRYKDSFYGYGRVNAYNAVKRIQRFAKTADIEIIEDVIPVSYELKQNYPNPFNPTTTIGFALPKDNHVSIKVYDLLGREVANLVNEYRVAGSYSIDFDASQLASGMYIYNIKAGEFSASKKLLLQK